MRTFNSGTHATHEQHSKTLNEFPGGGGGSTPSYGPNKDARLDRVGFSRGFVLNGVSISSIFVLNRVLLHDLMYRLILY